MKTSIKSLSCVALLTAGMLPAAGHATLLHNEDVSPNVIMGSGIPNGSFSVESANTIEVGLRARDRFVPNVNSDNGVFTFTVGEDSGNPGWATWNIDWSVNVNVDGNSQSDLDDFTYIFGGNENGVGGTEFDLINLTGPNTQQFALACAGTSFGTSTTAPSAGSEVACGLPMATIANYNNMLTSNSVAQNSWNPGLLNLAVVPGSFDPFKATTYNVWLAVVDANGGEVARSEITIKTVSVPEPTPLALLALGLLGLGFSRRRA